MISPGAWERFLTGVADKKRENKTKQNKTKQKFPHFQAVVLQGYCC